MIYNEINTIVNKLDIYDVQFDKHKVAKLSLQNQITEMNEKIKESSERIMEKVKEVIMNNSKENQKIIVAGIGNTLGVE